VHSAHEHEVRETVSFSIGLLIIISRATFAGGFDVADFAYHRLSDNQR